MRPAERRSRAIAETGTSPDLRQFDNAATRCRSRTRRILGDGPVEITSCQPRALPDGSAAGSGPSVSRRGKPLRCELPGRDDRAGAVERILARSGKTSDKTGHVRRQDPTAVLRRERCELRGSLGSSRRSLRRAGSARGKSRAYETAPDGDYDAGMVGVSPRDRGALPGSGFAFPTRASVTAWTRATVRSAARLLQAEEPAADPDLAYGTLGMERCFRVTCSAARD